MDELSLFIVSYGNQKKNSLPSIVTVCHLESPCFCVQACRGFDQKLGPSA